MDGNDELAERFEAHRGHLRAVAYRMLGSSAEADDAVQEAWLRLVRVDAGEIGNLAGWLTTVVSRVCLDMLRSRAARREDPLGQPVLGQPDDGGSDPEREALLAESVGRALLVVLDTLAPAERVAFVLHDLFAVPFDRIAPVVGRTTVTTKKLASRARHKVAPPRASGSASSADRRVVEAFLAASREGDMEALLAVLAPGVVRRADPATLPPGVPAVSRGARAVAGEVLVLGGRARYAEPALVDGTVGAVVAPYGRLLLVLTFTIEEGVITEYEVIADPTRLRALSLSPFRSQKHEK
ncbi:sigma-70 family RNA polymerase sigma factor [Streptosporangium sp. NPDC020072]|uniref:sigma-70 family RNA polymerase sigma factor n=1 Tax=Streptosporangium sp. NPDC020072 TaxID=3154788 RepID=UPI00343F3DFE